MSDDSSGALRQWLQSHLSPSVLVLTTPKADEQCRKNGVDFCDLVRPFSRLTGVNGTDRLRSTLMFAVTTTAGDQPTQIRDFRIHFVRPEDLAAKKSDETLAKIVEHLGNESDQKSWRGVKDVEDVSSFLRSMLWCFLHLSYLLDQNLI